MASARRIRWLCHGTLTAGLLLGLHAVHSQDAERAPDESVPPRAAPGKRQAAANAARARTAALSDATTDADSSADAAVNRESVDTSKNQRMVVRVEHTTAQSLASVLVKHFQGVPGLSLIPSVTSNSLLVSSPPKWLDEVTDTISKLDQPPRSATIEFTILEFSADEASKSIDLRGFHGPSAAVRAKIDAFKTGGQIQRIRRFRATSVDNQSTQFPANGGATVRAVARSSADKSVIMDLSVQDPALFPSGNVEGAPDGKASQFRSTVAIPPGMTVVAAEIETGKANGPARIVILVSADVILPTKPPDSLR